MRVLLFDASKGRYWGNEDSWTDQPGQARNFGTSLKAALYAQEHSLEESEVYLDFGDTDWDVRLPIGRREGRADAESVVTPRTEI